MAHTYAHLYRLPVHRPALLHRLRPLGPAGHGAVPVHAAILAGEPIKVFNHGKMSATSPTSTTSSKA
jgi:UDP-glucuronate 4-epimerase